MGREGEAETVKKEVRREGTRSAGEERVEGIESESAEWSKGGETKRMGRKG